MNIQIGNKIIGPEYKPYFIADIAANHDGDINRAFKLIELAKEAGIRYNNGSNTVTYFGALLFNTEKN